MLELRKIREDTEAVRAELERRGSPELLEMLDRVVVLDTERRSLISEVDTLRAKRNEESPRVAELKRAGAEEEARALITRLREIGERIDEREARLSTIEEEMRELIQNTQQIHAQKM